MKMLDSASFMVRPSKNDEVILLSNPARDFKKSPPFRKSTSSPGLFPEKNGWGKGKRKRKSPGDEVVRKYAMKLCSIHCYHLMHRVLRDILFGARQLRACLHGGGGPQVGEVTHLGGVTHLFV